MRIKCIGCEALARLLYKCAAESGHLIDIKLLKIGLHDTPEKLRSQLQQEIDLTALEEYDAITLAYGLCGQAIIGIIAKEIPIVIPRAHDCITLFLGSRKRYQAEMKKSPGTYWYSLDYMERKAGLGITVSLGSEMDSNICDLYQHYVDKYGAENADYLMATTGAWKNNYQRAVYLNLGVGDGEKVKSEALEEANNRGWRFESLNGDMLLLKQLLMGNWNGDFLIVHPGQHIAMSYDQDIVTSINSK
jgi:hypothetical protein